MAIFRNNKKKDWLSNKTGLVFVHGDVFSDGSRISATVKMEVFATVGNDRGFTTNGQYYLHVAGLTRPSLQPKLKSYENGHGLKAASDTISCFLDMLYIFSKTPITFCFTNILFHFEN